MKYTKPTIRNTRLDNNACLLVKANYVKHTVEILFWQVHCILYYFKSHNRSGPVIIIEDDMDDQDVLQEVFEKLDYPNKIIFFSDGDEALAFLNSTKELPFLILSDINLPC